MTLTLTRQPFTKPETTILALSDRILSAPRTALCRWWLVESRGNFDGRLIADLEQAGAFVLDIFEEKERSRPNGPRKTLRREKFKDYLFPGYVFFNGTVDHRAAATRSIATLKVIPVNQQEKLAAELANFMQAVSHGFSPRIVNLRRGQRVLISGGPMAGLDGEYLSARPDRVYVNVGILGRALELEVNPIHVQPI